MRNRTWPLGVEPASHAPDPQQLSCECWDPDDIALNSIIVHKPFRCNKVSIYEEGCDLALQLNKCHSSLTIFNRTTCALKAGVLLHKELFF